jgi:PAS domain S-box-containing protein
LLDRLTAIGEMTLAMSKAATVDQIYREVLRAVERTLEAPAASILLFDPDGVLRFKAWQGLSDGYRRAVEGHSPWMLGEQEPLPLLVPDVSRDGGLADHRERMLAEGIRAMALVPLLTGGGTIGKFMVCFHEPRAFPPETVQLAWNIAAHAAFAIDRQRAVDQLEAERGLFVGGPTVVFKWKNLPGWPAEYASPNLAGVFGWSPEALTNGRVPYAGLIHPADFVRVEAEEQRYLAEGRSAFEHEYRLRRADGEFRWVYDFTVPVHGPDGRLTHFRGYVLDITDRKAAAESLRDAEARLRETQRLESLGLLAGGIAHDFNNLLMGILGNAGLALSDVPASSAAHDSITEIEASARRAAELTRQLLAYSGKGKFVVERIDLSRLAEESARLLLPALSGQATLGWDLTSGLPQVEGDAPQLRQVVINLLTNASDALAEQPGVISIRSFLAELDEQSVAGGVTGRGLPRGPYVALEVRDTGTGMDEVTVRHIFDPFFTTKFQGRGLGLAAVLGIVRGHRGAIQVDSAPGQGTTFRILLPAVAEPAGRARPPGGDAGGGGPVRTVLVVDDEAIVRNVTRRTLERAGYRVLQAENGRAALELLTTAYREVGLVVLDLTMPELGGEETFALMHDRWPSLKVLFSSGYSADAGTNPLARKSLAGFIQKPYLPSELLGAVQRAFES